MTDMDSPRRWRRSAGGRKENAFGKRELVPPSPRQSPPQKQRAAFSSLSPQQHGANPPLTAEGDTFGRFPRRGASTLSASSADANEKWAPPQLMRTNRDPPIVQRSAATSQTPAPPPVPALFVQPASAIMHTAGCCTLRWPSAGSPVAAADPRVSRFRECAADHADALWCRDSTGLFLPVMPHFECMACFLFSVCLEPFDYT